MQEDLSFWARSIAEQKDYMQLKPDGSRETWGEVGKRVAEEVLGSVNADQTLIDDVANAIANREFMPGGRYLYGAGRLYHQTQNCFVLFVEDSREGWADLLQKATLALMSGGGIGVVYSHLREEGAPIRKTGGKSTGPIALMQMVNEAGRHIQQGGSRRAAIWAGLHWNHPDVIKFINLKNWSDDVKALKAKDYNFPAPMDMTNISVILDDAFFAAYHDNDHPSHAHAHAVYWLVIEQMCKTGEPGFSIDVGVNAGEHGRNACTEFTSHDDSDVCNLGSINMAKVTSLEHFLKLVQIGSAFLLAGTVYSDVPYAKVDQVRGKNRKIGLGVMGVHEWLLKRGYKYSMNAELEDYFSAYEKSGYFANLYADQWRLSHPKKTRSIAPTGTIGIVAETTTGIEPIFCVAYKRRYLKGNDWHYQYIIDPTAKRLIEEGVNPEAVEDAYSIDVERRVSFQAAIQKHVDMSISSTINLPHWGSASNNQSTLQPFGEMLMKYLPDLRGITVYPDGARSGQPLQPVKYSTAVKHQDEVFVEYGDVCDITKGGSCNS